MRLRRCAGLMFEPREDVAFSLEALLAGGDGLAYTRRWVAYAPHLQRVVELEEDELAALGRLGVARAGADGDIPEAIARSLVDKGLATDADADPGDAGVRDERFRATRWRTTSAVAHFFSRWSDAEIARSQSPEVPRTLDRLVSMFGPPPPVAWTGREPSQTVPLAQCEADAFDQAAQARCTCRNFDPTAVLPAAAFSRVMHRVFRAHAVVELEPGARFLKKNYPSGGGLHPLEAFLVVRRVEGVTPGLYRYDAIGHGLERIAEPAPEALARIASAAVAEQAYLATAPVLVVVAARFERTFWKYRDHAKAYRVLVLETGHASQLLYGAATDLGLGAFVTAAMGEEAIEAAFGFDPLELGALAVLGFGVRADRVETAEFDPLARVWPSGGMPG